MSATGEPAGTDPRAVGTPLATGAVASRAAGAFLLDVVAVVAFVAIGRRSHEDDSGLGNLLEIAAPFLIALAGAWLVLRLWRAPSWSNRAVAMWAITVAGGMALRKTVFDRGTAVSFVIVTAIVLGVFLLGWRGVAEQIRVRRRGGARSSLDAGARTR